jgi:hypothetical protein
VELTMPRFDVQVVRDGARKTGNFKRGNER